jgi:hypothetical protein
MWRRVRTARRPVAAVPQSVGAAAAPSVRHVNVDVITVGKVLVAGSVVGLLTGFFGVGGGFVIVPALVLALEFDMADAVGTSLLVIAINSVVALATRLHTGAIVWSTVVSFTVASVIGVVIGGHLARTRDSRSLQRWFVLLLVAVAAYTAIRSALALM